MRIELTRSSYKSSNKRKRCNTDASIEPIGAARFPPIALWLNMLAHMNTPLEVITADKDFVRSWLNVSKTERIRLLDQPATYVYTDALHPDSWRLSMWKRDDAVMFDNVHVLLPTQSEEECIAELGLMIMHCADECIMRRHYRGPCVDIVHKHAMRIAVRQRDVNMVVALTKKIHADVEELFHRLGDGKMFDTLYAEMQDDLKELKESGDGVSVCIHQYLEYAHREFMAAAQKLH